MEKIKVKEFTNSIEFEDFLNRIGWNNIMKVYVNNFYYGVIYKENY